MERDLKAPEDVVLARLLRLNASIYGVVFGLVAGITIFILTNWLVLKGGKVIGPHLSLLGQFFPGYEVTFVGSFIGLAYGFGTGFVLGFFVAFVYDWLVGRKDRAGAPR